MCPVNKLGHMDVYVVSHHGWYPSSSPAFVDGIAPRVAVMDNGETKGGSPGPWEVIEKSPRLKDLWQLHYSDEGGAQHNVADPFIANLKGASGSSDGHYIRVEAIRMASWWCTTPAQARGGAYPSRSEPSKSAGGRVRWMPKRFANIC